MTGVVGKKAGMALLGALASALLLVLTWALAMHVGIFQRADQAILKGFVDLGGRYTVNRLAGHIARLCDPSRYVFLAAVPVLVALLRRRARALSAIVTILLGANATTQLLKPLLAQPRANTMFHWHAVSPASWPSGHATAAMALALCCVLAAPPRWRPAVAALGAAFAVAVSFSFLTLRWHYPSDVFGGFLVAATWTLLAMAGVFVADARWPRATDVERGERVSLRDAIAPQLVALVGALLLAGVVALARPHQVVIYARAHEAFMIGAAAIGMLALSLSSVIALAIRR